MVTSYLRSHLAIKLPSGKLAYKSRPEFALFSQRVLVALDTDHGMVYVPASGWDRLYLHWTFRNFHSLPQNVLNPRQQQLIGSLYRESANHSADELYEAVVVGTVEDFDPSSLSALPACTKARKLDPGSSGSKSAEAPTLDNSQPFYVRFALNRKTLRVGAGALVAVIAILTWHQLGAQPISDSGLKSPAAAAPLSNEPSAVVKDPAITAPPSSLMATQPSPNPIAGTEPITQTPAGAIATTEVTAKTKTSGVSGKHEVNSRVASIHEPVTVPPSVYEASAGPPPMRISGRPQKLVYPVCPGTHVRGKVSLQAVVGYDGAVSRVRVLTGDRVLAAAAVEAVRQWRYEPFSGAAQSLERETDITVSFISNQVVAVSFPNSASVSR